MRGLLRVTFFLILLAAVGFGAGFALWAAKTYRKPNALPEGSTIEVARGEGSAAIARHLEAAHAVPSGLLFRIAGRLTGKDRKLRPANIL
jgi:cell division protein YceG involved in septum cleavage